MKQIIVDEYLLSDGSIDVASLREDLFDYFNTLHYMLSDTEFDAIASHALGWIQDHLANHDVFERSVQSKAMEMSSGDHHADYYKALLLRRDQLLAARDVFREYTSKLREIFSDDRESVLQSLKRFDFDHGIYLRAVEYAQVRDEQLMDYETLLEGEIEDIEAAIASEEQYMDLESADGDSTEKPKKRVRKSASSTGSAEKKTKSKRFFHKNI